MSLFLVNQLKMRNVMGKFVPAGDVELEDDTFVIDDTLYVQIAFYCEKPYILCHWDEENGICTTIGEFGRSQDEIVDLALAIHCNKKD